MKSVTVGTIINKEAIDILGHLIYVVQDGPLIFYVGQSRRDVVTRFWEHLNAPSRLGQLIAQNEPASHQWTVNFYELADCEQFVMQKSLFALQAWQYFDMDMAEQAMIQGMQPVLNKDFNEKPTPLPAKYHGHAALGFTKPNTFSPTSTAQDRVWLNRMSLQGWVYEKVGEKGRLLWKHSSGKTLSEADMLPYRTAGKLPLI